MTATYTNAAGLGIPLPPPELRLMGDTDERFVQVGRGLAEVLYRHGLTGSGSVLDVGSHVGRLAIGLLDSTSFHGVYRGFDVNRPAIRWAKRNLTPIAPDMTFRHLDVQNSRYNPNGTIHPRDVRFPAQSETYDVTCLFSIFTHFYHEDIGLYLRELHRVLRPGGRVVATWFLYDDERQAAAMSSPVYPMTHRLDDHTIYHDPDDPLRAIAFHEDKVRELIAAAQLEIVDVEYGKWAGGTAKGFQDTVVLRRPPLTTRQKLRRKAGAVKRRVLK